MFKTARNRHSLLQEKQVSSFICLSNHVHVFVCEYVASPVATGGYPPQTKLQATKMKFETLCAK